MPATIQGIVAYPVTPFTPEGRIAEAPLKQMLDRLVATGAHAIAPLGSTGESAYLTDDEWEQVAELSVRHVARRVPTIVGISDLTTANAVRRARFAQSVGADAVMVLPVSYWKLSEGEIAQYYRDIAQAIDLPVMLYNNPATSGIDLSPEFIVKLVNEIDNLTMVKESSGDVQRMHRIQQLSDGAIPFFNGSNPLALEAFAAGATGWCTAAHNLVPSWTLRLYEACMAGELSQARQAFYQQLPLLQFILKGGLPTTVKAGLGLLGVDAGEPRRPLQPLDSARRDTLKQMLKALNS